MYIRAHRQLNRLEMDERTDTCAAITLQVELIAAGTEERAAGVDTVVRAPAVVAPTLVHVRTLTLIPSM